MVPETSDGTPVQAMLTAKAARAAAAPRYAPTNRRPGKRSGLSLVWNAQTITGVSEEVSATYANPLLMRAALPTAVVGTPPTAPLFGRREESTPAPAHGRPLPCQASAAKDSTCSAPRVHKAPPSACPNLPAGWELKADGVRPFLPAAMAGAVKRAGPSPLVRFRMQPRHEIFAIDYAQQLQLFKTDKENIPGKQGVPEHLALQHIF